MNVKIINTTMLYVFVIFFAFFLATHLSFALTSIEADIIQADQESAMKYTGTFQPVYNDLVQVFTYETICKGFYTVEDNGVTINYTGFGELADEYTYTIEKPIVNKVASTTDEKIISTDIIDIPL